MDCTTCLYSEPQREHRYAVEDGWLTCNCAPPCAGVSVSPKDACILPQGTCRYVQSALSIAIERGSGWAKRCEGEITDYQDRLFELAIQGTIASKE